jgi:hypothetical protein
MATVVLAAAVVCAWTRDARACQVVIPGDLVLDPTEQQLDHQPPATPVLSDLVVKRGAVPNGCEGWIIPSGCFEVGVIEFFVTSTDDRTPPSQLGYQLTVVRGTPPRDLVGVEKAQKPWPNGFLDIPYTDGDPPQPLDFDVEVHAVDLAGNVSTGAATFTVRSNPQAECATDAGAPDASPPAQQQPRSSGGCQVGAGKPSGGGVGALGLLLLAVARRLRARTAGGRCARTPRRS